MLTEQISSLLEKSCLTNYTRKKNNDIIPGSYEIPTFEMVLKEELVTEHDNVNTSTDSHIAVEVDGHWNNRTYRTEYNSFPGSFEKTKLNSTDELIDKYGLFAINIKLFKVCQLYNVFNPNSKKMFGWNIYRLLITLWSVFVICYMIFGILGYFFEKNDTINQVELLFLLTNYSGLFMTILILVLLLFKSDESWNIFDVARFDFLSSTSCQKNVDILKKCCNIIIKITNIYFFLTLFVVIQWILFPLIMNMVLVIHNSYQRRRNIFDILVPVTIQTYNKFYIAFYLIEITITLYSWYSIFVCGTFLVSFCWIIIAQYDILYHAYKNIGYEKQSQNTLEIDVEILNDYHNNIIAVVADQQRLNSKLQLYYSVIRPIIITMVLFIGILIILLSVGFSLVYTSPESLSIINLSKIVSTLIMLSFIFFVICYLLETIKNKKDTINFGIYSCNWTNMDLKTKQLILQTIQMNNVNKQVLKMSPEKMIDLQIFVSVISMCYNIIYMLIKIIHAKKQKLE